MSERFIERAIDSAVKKSSKAVEKALVGASETAIVAGTLGVDPLTARAGIEVAKRVIDGSGIPGAKLARKLVR